MLTFASTNTNNEIPTLTMDKLLQCINDIKVMTSEVLLVHPDMEMRIKSEWKDRPTNLVFICSDFCEPDKMYLVTDKTLKEMLLNGGVTSLSIGCYEPRMFIESGGDIE